MPLRIYPARIMPVGICPHCYNRYAYNEYDVDYVHTCHGSAALSQEDRPIIDSGNFNLLGLADKKGGKSVGISSIPKVYSYTRRGNRAVTHYQRQYYEYIDLNEE